MRCDRVEDVLVAVTGQGNQEHVCIGDEGFGRWRNARMDRALDGAGGDQRFARCQSLRAFARPSSGLRPFSFS